MTGLFGIVGVMISFSGRKCGRMSYPERRAMRCLHSREESVDGFYEGLSLPGSENALWKRG